MPIATPSLFAQNFFAAFVSLQSRSHVPDMVSYKYTLGEVGDILIGNLGQFVLCRPQPNMALLTTMQCKLIKYTARGPLNLKGTDDIVVYHGSDTSRK
jgi:hypothetical protein